LQAIAEGIHIFRTDKEGALKVMSKYTKVTDQKVLELTHTDNKEAHNPTLLPTPSGIKSILETIAGSNPQAAKADPASFIDARLAKKLEESGFLRSLSVR